MSSNDRPPSKTTESEVRVRRPHRNRGTRDRRVTPPHRWASRETLELSRLLPIPRHILTAVPRVQPLLDSLSVDDAAFLSACRTRPEGTPRLSGGTQAPGCLLGSHADLALRRCWGSLSNRADTERCFLYACYGNPW